MLWPILNVMQSLPHFSYLIPVALFIGVSHRAGAIATILFAIPPMTRLTVLGLKGVAEEVREAGRMAGCTRWQMLFKVEIPAARDSLMLGVNQVIMQCLAMVVIASFVGAKGLGQDLLFRLQSLRLGQALENGVAVVLMAVMLDRLSRALSEKQPERRPEGLFWRVHPYLMAAGVVIVASIVAALLTPHAQALPRSATITTAPFWDSVVDFITITLYDPALFHPRRPPHLRADPTSHGLPMDAVDRGRGAGLAPSAGGSQGRGWPRRWRASSASSRSPASGSAHR